MSGERKKRVHVAELRDLGFSEALIEEAVEREKFGVLDVELPADLLQRTILECAALDPPLESAPEDPRRAVLVAALRQLMSSLDFSTLPALVLPTLRAAFAHWEGLPLEYIKAIPFALQTRQRPLVILENHNLIKPRWWRDNDALRSIDLACRRVNEVAASAGVEPSARVVVLNPDVSCYDRADLEMIAKLLHEATSDVWWLPVAKAGAYADQDIVVIGDREVLTMSAKADSPQEAFAAMGRIEVSTEAANTRRGIEQLLSQARPIKRHGRFVESASPLRLRSAQEVKESLRVVIG